MMFSVLRRYPLSIRKVIKQVLQLQDHLSSAVQDKDMVSNKIYLHVFIATEPSILLKLEHTNQPPVHTKVSHPRLGYNLDVSVLFFVFCVQRYHLSFKGKEYLGFLEPGVYVFEKTLKILSDYVNAGRIIPNRNTQALRQLRFKSGE